MRLVVWNCRDASQKKFEGLQALAFDIAVVPEVSRQQLSAFDFPKHQTAWVGPVTGKGLAILVGSLWSIEAMPVDRSQEWFLPVVCQRGTDVVHLHGVWAIPKASSYANAVKNALECYGDWLKSGPSIVAGDFNANVALGRDGSKFANVVAQLHKLGLVSAWHQHHSETHGQESRHSHFHMFKPDRPFHIDFAFVPDLPGWRPRSVRLGDFTTWIGEVRSDHVPLVIDFP